MSTFDGYTSVVLDLLEGLNTPVSLKAYALITHQEWVQLAEMSVNPAHYLTASEYLCDAQAAAILKKFQSFPKQLRKRAQKACHLKWSEAEKLCYLTNQRFRNYNSGYFPDVAPRVVEFLYQMRKIIAGILGRVPQDLIDCRHGKGATFYDMGTNCTVLHKMQSQPTISGSARCLLPLYWGSAWGRALARREKSDPLTVQGNRFTTVPKNAKTDRPIAIEPSLNIYFQLGVGTYIRKRLLKAGVDLDDGQQTHRALARRASIDNALATLDLSSASDTVAFELVKFLLPEDWFQLLSSLRSEKTMVEKRWYRLEKFSSMGNGFTFELETLIFFSACRALCESEPVFCYGDDIIVPAHKGQVVCEALKFLGFLVNEDKSFITGNFRESCGGDYFLGQDVRPIFLKEPPNEPHQWIAFANSLRLLSHRLSGAVDRLDPRVRRAYARVLGFLPSPIRKLKGPAHLGDTVLHSDDPSTWCIRIRNQIRYVKCWVPVTRAVSLLRFDPDVQLAAALYGVPSTGALSRDSVTGYRERWVACSSDTHSPYPDWLGRFLVPN